MEEVSLVDQGITEVPLAVCARGASIVSLNLAENALV